ncbi:MAG: AAA family ATPase [Candidatus Methanoperedens sp.]
MSTTNDYKIEQYIKEYLEGYERLQPFQSIEEIPGDFQLAALIPLLHSHLSRNPSSKILDIGCGNGVLFAKLEENGDFKKYPKLEYIGFDFPDKLHGAIAARKKVIISNQIQLLSNENKWTEHIVTPCIVVIRNVFHELKINEASKLIHEICMRLPKDSVVLLQDMTTLPIAEKMRTGWLGIHIANIFEKGGIKATHTPDTSKRGVKVFIIDGERHAECKLNEKDIRGLLIAARKEQFEKLKSKYEEMNAEPANKFPLIMLTHDIAAISLELDEFSKESISKNSENWKRLYIEHSGHLLVDDLENRTTFSEEQKFKAFREDIINEKIPNFVGREFVFTELEAFLKDNDCGYFVINGEPGIGKTSLIAYLANKHNCICHFNVKLLNIVTAENFLRNVCMQLTSRYKQSWQFIPDRDCKDGLYLMQLLENISRSLPNGERLIILVDALDEAQKETGPNRLYLPPRLPPSVYFVVTTRPLSFSDMQLFVECPRKDFSIESSSPNNFTDVRKFIEFMLKRGPLLIKLQAAQLNVNKFVETLLQKSEGNFMYLHYIIPELESGNISIGELPQGLIGYYNRHWEKMKSSENWSELKQPVICVLASVREPVTVKQVAELTRRLTPTQLKPSDVASVIADWRQFLKESGAIGEKRYQLYHTSFQDFLKQMDEVGEVDLKQTHQHITEVIEQQVKKWLKLGKGNL